MQALKSLFSSKAAHNEPPTEASFDHSKLDSDQDVSQCPFMKNKMTEESKNPEAAKCPHPQGQKAAAKQKAKKDSEEVESSSDEEELPRGGCPFMGASTKKKNPDLYQFNTGYDEPFVSKFAYYLSSNKIDFGALKKKKVSLPVSKSREVFDSYPIYLKHSLFFNGEDYQKCRGLECCSRFMPYEKLREKGNKLYNKGKYTEALDLYERALSLFKWLELYEEEDLVSSKHQSLEMIESQQSIDAESLQDITSKIHLNLSGKSQAGVSEESDPQFDQMRNKYKEFFVVYNDSNTKLFNGEDMTETADVDMRKSLMLQIYLNMAACYIHLNHYSVALQCIQDCFALTDKVSQVYLRKAQVLLMNKNSSLSDLKEAQALMQKAIEIKKTEKIFESNENLLKMVNLHNADEAYQKTLKQISERIDEKSKQTELVREKVYNRAKEIKECEDRLISEGKTPYQRHEEPMQESKEFKILERMRQKYIKVVEFYTEAQNKEQISLAKNELQELLKVFSEMSDITNCQIAEESDQLGGIESQKVQKRITTIKKNFCEDIYNSGRFNFTVMEWAIKEIIKEEREQQQAQKKAQQAEKAQSGENCDVKEGKGSDILKKASWGLVLLPIAGIVLNSFLF